MNPDPHVLYVVIAVVATSLLAWVAFVLLRTPKRQPPATTPAVGHCFPRRTIRWAQLASGLVSQTTGLT